MPHILREFVSAHPPSSLSLVTVTGDFIRLFYRAPASAERQFPARTELWEGRRKEEGAIYFCDCLTQISPLYVHRVTFWRWLTKYRSGLKINKVGMNTSVLLFEPSKEVNFL